MVIGLKYQTYNIASPTSPVTATPKFFDSLVCDYKYLTEREVIRTGRGKEISHLKTKKGYFDLVISADELSDNDKYQFMNNFYIADNHWISVATTNPVANPVWKEVVLLNSGEIPYENIEGNRFLREIKLKLIDKDGL